MGPLHGPPLRLETGRPEECSDGTVTDVRQDSGCDEKDEAVPEDVTLGKDTHMTGTLADISQHWKHQR